PVVDSRRLLLARPGRRDRRVRDVDWLLRLRCLRWSALAKSVRRRTVTRRLCVTSLCYVFCATSLASYRPAPFAQQLSGSQRRMEDIRRERTPAEQELERLRGRV